MSKVIVFGGSGFLGSHVADKLSFSGHQVTIFDIKDSPYLKSNQKIIINDISNLKEDDILFRGVNYIYNFAGIADIEEAKNNPLGTVKSNILNNMILLNACKFNKIKRYIFASSVYANSQSGNFYSISKKSCEEYIKTFSSLYNLEYTILRFGSLYGPRSNIKNGVYKFIYDAINNNKIVFKGEPESLREFIYVEDAALSSLEILNKEFINQTITLTGQQLMKIKDLLLMIKEILNNSSLNIKYIKENNQHYRITPYSYNSNLSKKLSPRLYTDLGEGLLEIIEEISKKK